MPAGRPARSRLAPRSAEVGMAVAGVADRWRRDRAWAGRSATLAAWVRKAGNSAWSLRIAFKGGSIKVTKTRAEPSSAAAPVTSRRSRGASAS
ncbi:hypothetical protein G6F31_018477 [Rhizopus arrhizus]|nr:hypothetical protein G6F31_018477 [Rhizopus arrhizus]